MRLREYLGETIRQRGLNGIEQLALSLVVPTVITFSWLYGLGTRPRRARIYGLYAAIPVGLLFFTIVVVSLINQTPKRFIPPTLSRFDIIVDQIAAALIFFS